MMMECWKKTRHFKRGWTEKHYSIRDVDDDDGDDVDLTGAG
jgi:hypothetical protein